MNDLDMSRPGAELFQESTQSNYNSYGVTQDQFADDPLNTGVKSPYDDAGHMQSSKEMNFQALREETAKFKEQSEYWRGKAEAYSQAPKTLEPARPKEADYSSLDWSDGGDVRKAFESLKTENERIRFEFQDQLAAVQMKAKHQDWDNMVTQHVPQLTSKNPIFAEMIKNSSNPYEAAYLLSELNSKASNPQQDQYNSNGHRAQENARKPIPPTAIGGQGSLSKADYYASLSDEDFMKIAGKNLANV